MMGRTGELQRLAEKLTDREEVVEAWTAKSFTDRLFVVELASGTEFPPELRAELRSHDLRGYNAVHDVFADDDAFAGDLERGDRYRFVDVRERGELQSYVID
jgi:hypothetical protein